MEKLLKDISQKTLSHCYLLFGEDEQARKSTLLDVAGKISDSPPYILVEKPKFAEVQEMVLKMTEARISDGLVVFIIPAVDGITLQGQNKLLKTLEEPERGVIVLMGANSEAGVLATVKSRAKKIHMPVVTKSLMSSKYSGFAVEFVDVLTKLKTTKQIPALSKKLPQDKAGMFLVVEILSIIAEQLLSGRPEPILEPLKKQYNQSGLANFDEIVRTCYERLDVNVSPSAVGERMLYRMLEVCYRTR